MSIETTLGLLPFRHNFGVTEDMYKHLFDSIRLYKTIIFSSLPEANSWSTFREISLENMGQKHYVSCCDSTPKAF